MDEDLKEMEFSIICKDGDTTVKLAGSVMGLAALIAAIAVNDNDVKKIIKLAVIGLNAKETCKLGETREHTANN
jgi:hypothetical protein